MNWEQNEVLMRNLIKQLHAEQSEHSEQSWETHRDRLETARTALRQLYSSTVDGIDNFAFMSALDEDQILRMLEMLPLLREQLDNMEIELLDAARHAGVSWEAINTVYAPIPAAAAKARYVELAMRVYGSSVVGPTNDTNA